jgi:hypothetical protein
MAEATNDWREAVQARLGPLRGHLSARRIMERHPTLFDGALVRPGEADAVMEERNAVIASLYADFVYITKLMHDGPWSIVRIGRHVYERHGRLHVGFLTDDPLALPASAAVDAIVHCGGPLDQLFVGTQGRRGWTLAPHVAGQVRSLAAMPSTRRDGCNVRAGAVDPARKLLHRKVMLLSVQAAIDQGKQVAEGQLAQLQCAREGCSALAYKMCGRCQDAYYCSEACQRAAWRSHKLTCTPIT